jgi:hypothetical protein
MVGVDWPLSKYSLLVYLAIDSITVKGLYRAGVIY